MAAGMRKFGVLLHIRNLVFRQEDQGEQRAGAFINCCVDAVDSVAAGDVALGVLRSHAKYRELEAWPPGNGEARPTVEVESVDVLSKWRRPFKRGVSTGFVFYLDTDEQP